MAGATVSDYWPPLIWSSNGSSEGLPRGFAAAPHRRAAALSRAPPRDCAAYPPFQSPAAPRSVPAAREPHSAGGPHLHIAFVLNAVSPDCFPQPPVPEYRKGTTPAAFPPRGAGFVPP